MISTWQDFSPGKMIARCKQRLPTRRSPGHASSRSARFATCSRSLKHAVRPGTAPSSSWCSRSRLGARLISTFAGRWKKSSSEKHSLPSRGPGRPKLGVTSREVSLFPRTLGMAGAAVERHRGALRRLVEHAFKSQPGKERARRIRAALSCFLSSTAGHRPHYEEATRALFNGDVATFERLVRCWPKDIQDYALQKAGKQRRWMKGEAKPCQRHPRFGSARLESCDNGEIERLVGRRRTRSTPTRLSLGRPEARPPDIRRECVEDFRDMPSPIGVHRSRDRPAG